MKLADFHYDLPAAAIAQKPIEPRDHSRLLVLDRQKKTFSHQRFYEIIDFLKPGDVLVVNATRVFPARLRGRKKTGGKVDVLLLEPLLPSREKVGMRDSVAVSTAKDHPSPHSSRNDAGLGHYKKLRKPRSPLKGEEDQTLWRALVRGVTRPTSLMFEGDMHATMEERLTEGEWLLRFSRADIRAHLETHGEMPLPPYIKRPLSRSEDLDQYQTVYAEKEGAVAAPTAGFHFTPELLEKIRAKGISVFSILLHVGWGTFRPIRSDQVEEHRMLPEAYEMTETVANELTLARRQGRRIIAVGTTAVRTLETVCDAQGTFHGGQGRADLFIYPGYRFKGVDALITNFHLPDATPLLLANAFYADQPNVVTPAGRKPGSSGVDAKAPGSRLTQCRDDNISAFVLRDAYAEAIRQGYRFYSYGDAMFIQ